MPQWLTVFETILAMFIAVDWLFGLFLSDQRITYIFSEYSLVAYLTVIPLLLVNFSVVTDPAIIKGGYLYVWRVACWFSILRLQRLFTRHNNQMHMLVFKSIWRAFAIILIFGAAFLTFENLAMY